MPICDVCGRKMVALFITAVCPWCEHQGPFDAPFDLDVGWIVWRGNDPERGHYVFPTQRDAMRWRSANALDAHPVVRVLSESRFVWRKSSSSVSNLAFADRLYEIFPDHRFRAGPNRAFVDPRQPGEDDPP